MAQSVAVIGAGPAGLIAAERLAEAGCAVTVHDRLASPARRLLMAGRGGLNLTHDEDLGAFVENYGAAAPTVRDWLDRFGPEALRGWAAGLGVQTFVGSSRRVFPSEMKASPLLRAWLSRLERLGVRIETRQRFVGWDETGQMRFETPAGIVSRPRADAALLALGGLSWEKLGADRTWPALLERYGITIAMPRAVNCGFRVDWSAHLRASFAGTPLKHVGLRVGDAMSQGDAIVTPAGLEGGAVYGLGTGVPIAVQDGANAVLEIDLRPTMTQTDIATRLAREGSAQSLANRMRRALRLAPVAMALLREDGTGGVAALPVDPVALAARIKALRLPLRGVSGLDRAISSAGGVALDALDRGMMLRVLPGVFAAGEMLDWAAPTGGYLLQAAFASGVTAAEGILDWLGEGRSG